MYELLFSAKAKKHLQQLRKSEPKVLQKVTTLLHELRDHPQTGTGKPKPLSGNLAGFWSRRITDKHRLIYKIKEAEIEVFVVSAYGHYDDK